MSTTPEVFEPTAVAPTITPLPITPLISPEEAAVIPQENWIDHEFLFHNEHVRVVGPNTVSISGSGIIKRIIRPGYGHYPLPKAVVEIEVIGKVQLNDEIFQNSRDPSVQVNFIKRKQDEILTRQLSERYEKQEKDLANLRKNHGDKAEIEAMKKNHLRDEEEAKVNHQKFVDGDNRHDLFWQPTKFQFGQKEVVRGLELAVATMKVGEIALITCRPEFAYSDLGIEDFIPDNAVIEYEVELLSADAASVEIYPGVGKKFITKGEGWTTPDYNSTCEIYIEGSFAIEDDEDVENPDDVHEVGTVRTKRFLKRTEHPIQCRIDDVMLPEGLEECLKTMKRGEVAIFEITKNILLGNGFEPKRHCYQLPVPQVPSIKNPDIPSHDLIVFYKIEMVQIHHQTEVWAMKLEDRITESERIKEVANDFFRLGLQSNQSSPDVPQSYTLKNQIGYLSRAIQRYDACLDLYEHFQEYEQKQCTYGMISRVIGVQLACHNNLQIIYAKLKKHKETEAAAAKAVELFMTPFDIYKHEVDHDANALADAVSGVVDDKKEILTTSPNDPTTSTISEPPLVAPRVALLPDSNGPHDEEALNESNTGAANGVTVVKDETEGDEIKARKAAEPPSKPSLATKAVLVGKTFPKQTNTNNLFKTLYRRAQALLLLDDAEAADLTVKLLLEIYEEKPHFVNWKESIDQTLAAVERGEKDSTGVPLYKEQPILLHGIIPLKKIDYHDKEQDKLFPIQFDTVTDDVKKEIEKLKVLIDKKQSAARSRGKQAWAKAFQDDE